MQKVRDIPWSRIGAESVAIVVSILLAFAINAWWGDRLERGLESQQLERLRAELQGNLELLDGFRSAQRPFQRSIDSGLQILEMIETAQAESAETISVPMSLLWPVTQANTFEAETAVLDGLVRSGGLDVVRDQRVVIALAAWERSVRDYAELAVTTRNTSETLLLPALHARADIAFTLMTGGRARLLNSSPLDDATEIAVTIDNELKGFIAQKTLGMNRAGITMTEMQNAAEAAIDAIDISLGE
jgi:hypothetical protein